MDENLINQTLENYDATEEVIEEVVVDVEEEVVVDISESMGWVSGDNKYHDSLLGVDFPRQHPIGAITNLREELNEIERLKTVYSNKFNVANYYKWKDAAYDTDGYFVSVVDGDQIQICNGQDIFGVVVKGGQNPDAGFIGGQDITTRDNTYGLVVTSGIVDVRCELDVNIGDHVVSNSSGYAKKSESNYGYKVVGTETKDSVPYAVIVLGAQADTTNLLGVELAAVEGRVSVNETNIISAINVANQAYNKAESAAGSASSSLGVINDALAEILGFGETLDNLGQSVTSSSIISAQAKAIAESAATSAVSIRNDAVAKADEALSSTADLRNEFETKIAEIDIQLDNAAQNVEDAKKEIQDIVNDIQGSINDFEEIKDAIDEMDQTIRDLNDVKENFEDALSDAQGLIQQAGQALEDAKEGFAGTVSDLQGQINDATQEIEDLAKDLEPLATWPEGATGDDIKGIVGFVAQANENSATLATVADYTTGTNYTPTSYDDVSGTTSNGITYTVDGDGSITANGTATAESRFYIIASTNCIDLPKNTEIKVRGCAAGGSDSTYHLYAGFGRYARYDTGTGARFTTTDTDYSYWMFIRIHAGTEANNLVFKPHIESVETKGLAAIKQKADANGAQLDAVAKYSKDGKTGLAGLIAQVDASKSAISAIASRSFTDEDGNTVSGLAGLQAQVDETKSDVSLVASRVNAEYEIIYKDIGSGAREQGKIYSAYEAEGVSSRDYILFDEAEGSWTWFATMQLMNSYDVVDQNTVYYEELTKTYWYYNQDTKRWTEVSSASEAGLPASTGGLQIVADENKAQLSALVEWKDGSGDNSLAGYIAEVGQGYATTAQISQVNYAVAAVQTIAEENKASISALTGIDGDIAGLLADVDSVKSQVSLVSNKVNAEYEIIYKYPTSGSREPGKIYSRDDASSETGKYYFCKSNIDDSWLAYSSVQLMGDQRRIDKNTVYYEELTKTYWYYNQTTKTWTEASTASEAGLPASTGGLQIVADENKAKLEALVSWKDGSGNDSLAGVIAEANKDYAKSEQIAKVNESIAAVSAIAESNKSSLSALAGVNDNIAGLRADVDDNKAELLTIADYTAGTDYTPTSYDDTSGKVSYGITYTIGDDESITANGTATGESRFNIRMSTNKMTAPNDKWLRATGCPPNGSNSTYYIYIGNISEGSGRDVGSGAKFKTQTGSYYMWITIKSGTTVNNLVFKPHVESVETEGLAAIKHHTSRNASSIDLLSSWQDNARSSMAHIEQKADANKAQLNAVASYSKDGKTGLAGLVAQVDENVSNVSLVASRVNAEYQIIYKYPTSGDRETDKLYSKYTDESNTVKRYYRYSASSGWGSYGSIQSMVHILNQNTVYYEELTKTYWYYNQTTKTWTEASSASEAGLPASTGGLQIVADENKAQLDAMVAYDKDGKSALAGMTAYADQYGANISTLAKYDNKDSKNKGTAGLVADVNDNTSTLSVIANYSATDENGKTVSGLAGLRAQVDSHKSELSNIANYTTGTNYTPTSYYYPSGTTRDGITYTVGDDGSITANGTATGDSQFSIVEQSNSINLPNNTEMTISGCPTGGSTSTYYIHAVCDWSARYDTGNGIRFTTRDTDSFCFMYITIKSGTTVNNLVFKPHIESVETEGLAAIKQRADQTSSSIDSLAFWKNDAKSSMARIEQKADANGAYIQSTVANIDKYSVGPYSQAYGFTLEQAENVLEEGTIYVPTEDKNTDAKKEIYKYANEAISVDSWNTTGKDKSKVYRTTDTKKYYYYKNNAWANQTTEPEYERTFLKGYLYKWGKVQGRGAWIAVDKNYQGVNETSADSTSSSNTSSMAVYFSTREIAMGSGNNYGYWYTNGTSITPLTGSTATYEPYTLYKWDSYVDENDATQYHWVAVATLSRNSQSRAVSQIRQHANSIESSVTGLAGEYAGTKATVEADHAKVGSIAAWPNGDGTHNMAILEQKADGNGTYMTLAAVRDVDGKSEITEFGGAKFILSDTSSGSVIKMDADSIDFTAGEYTINANHINLNGAVTANNNVTIGADGKITAVNANITGTITATAGAIANYKVIGNRFYSQTEIDSTAKSGIMSGLYAGNYNGESSSYMNKQSLVTPTVGGKNYYSSVRFFAGAPYATTSEKFRDGKFVVLEDGSLYASAASITGNITATGGMIGGFTLNDGKLYTGSKNNFALSTTGGVYIGPDGIAVHSGPIKNNSETYDYFGVTLEASTGKFVANNAEISGKITATSGSIGGLTLDNNSLTKTITTTTSTYLKDTEAEFTISPGAFTNTFTKYASGAVPTYIHSVEINNGVLHTKVNDLIYSTFGLDSYFMKVTVNNQKYALYIDPGTLNVYAKLVS